MRVHGNARLTPHGRGELARRVLFESWSTSDAARAAAVSERTARKWVRRFHEEGPQGLVDRSSAPHRVPRRTPPDRERAILALRRVRMTAAEIAEVLSMPLSTVSAVLARCGLGRLSRLEPLEPANRYQRAQPGELVHVDVKRLARIDGIGHRISGSRAGQPRRTGRRRIGYEYVHVLVDDATRLAYAEVLGDERAHTATGFLIRALRWFRSFGVAVQRVMTDNGSAFVSHLYGLACRIVGLRHLRTRPRRPRTNGKAERFIRTMLDRWAYGAIYRTSAERSRALPGWLDSYNCRRPHGSLNRQTPLQRLTALRNNVTGSYI